MVGQMLNGLVNGRLKKFGVFAFVTDQIILYQEPSCITLVKGMKKHKF